MSEQTDRILLAYHDLFRVGGGEAAKIVLADMCEEAFQTRTTFATDEAGRTDPIRMAFNEGQRAFLNKIFLRIEEGAKIQGEQAPQPTKYASSDIFEEHADLYRVPIQGT